MNILDMLDELQRKAQADETLRVSLLATRACCALVSLFQMGK